MKILTKASVSDLISQRELDNLKLAYEAAGEAIVLLKNDGCLPFKTKKVALYGSGATKTIKGGTGSGEVNERRAITIYEGMKDRGYEITTETWLNDYESCFDVALQAYKAEKKKRVNILKPSSIMNMLFDNFRYPSGRAISEEDVKQSQTDSCVYILSRQAGEGGDRRLEAGDYYLTQEEKEAISFCAAHYEHFVLVINSGSPIDVGFLDEIESINAVIFLCQLGSEGGHAFADLLSGVITPSGKLADTWARQYEDIPFAMEYSHLNGNVNDEFYREGIYVGYRYFDSFGIDPAFPFGFGLSYTQFEIKKPEVAVYGKEVVVSVSVANVGALYCGKEVLQLYVSAPSGTLKKEYQSLVAFAKTDIVAPGADVELTLKFNMSSLASYRESDSSYILESGDYILRLGNSSRKTVPIGVVTLEREVVISKHVSVCPVSFEIDTLWAPERTDEVDLSGVPRIAVNCDEFKTVVHNYEEKSRCIDKRTEKFLQELNLPEMAEIVVGIGMFGGKKQFDLPGSVGNTTSKFWDRGLSNVALCDGPAGLRIQRRSTVNSKGKIKPVDLAMSVFELFPNFVKRLILGDPAKEKVLYQYTTAFPVEAALAQTWNTSLLTRIGNGIYREMKEYGCTYWLAPAVNIHRNPLCGRHFEYFSEDPFLTGKMAAAITIGVQQEPGYYVSVKHFACNNQEDNRNKVSSNLNERALREIYLKAFEIAVREGNAKGVMTSYNRVNGVYAPNSHDLCTKVLRNEWGFDGVVMTDWFSTSKGHGDTALAMHAGNDLIMPGGRRYKKEILNGVKTGRISENDLRRCCANVVKAIFDSATQREYIDAK